MQSLKPGVGNWVDGERFFNRDRELELLMRHLLDGESILLVAQRRMGKTSLMREAARRLGDQVIALHVDLEKAHTAADAVVELSVAAQEHESFGKRVSTVFSDIFENTLAKIESLKLGSLSIALRGGLTDDNWQKKGDDLVAFLAETAKQQGKPVILFFDEVPILVTRLLRSDGQDITPEGREAADAFMSWLRDNLNRHGRDVVQVVTGSVGLEPILAQAGLNGTLNSYHPFELGPWRPATAVMCLAALAKHRGLPLEEAEAQQMVNLLGVAIPHHVQMFFDHVHRTYVVGELSGPVSAELVAEVYEDSMTGLRGHPELSHMEERLKLVMGPAHFSVALNALTEAAVSGYVTVETIKNIVDDTTSSTTGDSRIATDVLAILLHDGYLQSVEGRFSFSSNLLRDWWNRRFGLGYKPLAQQ